MKIVDLNVLLYALNEDAPLPTIGSPFDVAGRLRAAVRAERSRPATSNGEPMVGKGVAG